MSFDEWLSPAMSITDQADADQYFNDSVAYLQEITGFEKDIAEKTIRTNLGYFAGYYDHPTRLRIEKLFSCEHPILGNASDGELTPQEIFSIGVKWGQEALKKVKENDK